MQYATKPPRYETTALNAANNNRELMRLPDGVKPPEPMTDERALMLARMKATMTECERLIEELKAAAGL